MCGHLIMKLNGIINDTVMVMISVCVSSQQEYLRNYTHIFPLKTVQWVDSFSKLLPVPPAVWWHACCGRYLTLARHISIFHFAQPLQISAFVMTLLYWMNCSYLRSSSPLVFPSHVFYSAQCDTTEDFACHWKTCNTSAATVARHSPCSEFSSGSFLYWKFGEFYLKSYHN